MWEAKAKYADGSTVCKLFADNPYKSEAEQIYDLESWLIERDGPECTWYSVNWIFEEELEDYETEI